MKENSAVAVAAVIAVFAAAVLAGSDSIGTSALGLEHFCVFECLAEGERACVRVFECVSVRVT